MSPPAVARYDGAAPRILHTAPARRFSTTEHTA
jgi:hypothetical protein